VFGRFVGEVQQRFGTNIRPEDVIATFAEANAPVEIAELLSKLDALG
jgi:hypothetical protein